MRGGKDAGVGMVEMLVASSIAGVLLTALGTVTIGTFRGLRATQVRIGDAADARIGADAMSRTLRAATVPLGETAAITTAAPTSLTFYSQLARTGVITVNNVPVPTRVEYYVSGGCLWEAQTPARKLATPSASGSVYAWDTGRAARCLLRSTPPATLFSYYASGSATTPMVAATATLPAADLKAVRSVRFLLVATDPTPPVAPGVTVDSRITLDNVALAAGGTA